MVDVTVMEGAYLAYLVIMMFIQILFMLPHCASALQYSPNSGWGTVETVVFIFLCFFLTPVGAFIVIIWYKKFRCNRKMKPEDRKDFEAMRAIFIVSLAGICLLFVFLLFCYSFFPWVFAMCFRFVSWVKSIFVSKK